MTPRRLALELAILAAVCAGVFWTRLGATGISMSEGHRVLPAWEMLDSGEWLVPRLFGQAYLRKPPGMPWAVALSSEVFGRTEFAVRAVSAVSATAMAFLAYGFARRWFGPPWALAAGLMSALTPVFWSTGRSAEIEALNNAASMAAVLLLLDVTVFRGLVARRSRSGAVFSVVLLAVALLAAALAKGPASVPCLVAAIGAACIATRSAGPLRDAVMWGGVALAGAGVGALAWAILRAAEGLSPVLQGPGEFLWNGQSLSARAVWRVVKLAPESLAIALPATLGLIVCFRGRAARSSEEPGTADSGVRMASALAWTCLLSLAIFVTTGVNNPRYTLPAFTIVPLLAAFVAREAATGLDERGRRLARTLLLGSPLAWPVVLLIAAGVYVGVVEPRKRASSGREPGIALAAALPDGAEVWADDLIEARPEVLHYARQRAAGEGRRVTIRWMPRRGGPPRIPPESGNEEKRYIVLRTDTGSNERELCRQSGALDRLRPVTDGRVHDFAFTLYEVIR
ncbi:MAG: ArnT family glycosyltransferase [Phycisphaerales bacterium]